MSSGNLEIIINDCKYAGIFNNGVLTNGTIEDKYNIYSGNFMHYQLNGDNCSHYNKLRKKQHIGKFINGQIVEGKTIYNNNLLEQGIYSSNGVYSELTNGTIYKDYVYNGEFYAENIKKGTASYKIHIIYNGLFSILDNCIEQGIITYNNIGLTVRVKLAYDLSYHGYILEQCEVIDPDLTSYIFTDYKQFLSLLNRKQLVMVLCSGFNSKNAHKFYINYMKYLEVDKSYDLKSTIDGTIDINKLSDELKSGYELILSNLEKIKQKKYATPNNTIENCNERNTYEINIPENIVNKHLQLIY